MIEAPLPPPVPGFAIKVDFPAAEVLRNRVLPPAAPATAPPFPVITEADAVELSAKIVVPPGNPAMVAPLLVRVAASAVAVSVNSVTPPLLTNTAFAAVEPSEKMMELVLVPVGSTLLVNW